MSTTKFAPGANLALLIARVLLVLLFLYSGWGKLTGFSGSVAYMSSDGVPFPEVAAIIAVLAEVPAMVLILIGFYTRPLAILLAIYTIGTAFLGHPYWAVPDAQHTNTLLHFYKNISIAGGFLALYAAGAGAFSLDAARSK